jgi:hypothetical protein
MIKNPEMLKEFEKSYSRGRTVDYFRNLEVLEGLFAEASALGVFPLKNALDGIEVDIRLARAINVPTSA